MLQQPPDVSTSTTYPCSHKHSTIEEASQCDENAGKYFLEFDSNDMVVRANELPLGKATA